jgi:hypothetical protein
VVAAEPWTAPIPNGTLDPAVMAATALRDGRRMFEPGSIPRPACKAGTRRSQVPLASPGVAADNPRRTAISDPMLSPSSRALLSATALLYAILGAILFVAPSWAAANFAWTVSPMVAMTIGGWCLGNACSAWVSLRRDPAAAFCPTLYLVLFGPLQAAVLIGFRALLLLDRPLAWLYLAALAVNVAFAGTVARDWWRNRPVVRRVGAPFGATEICLTIVFILLVGFLGLYGLAATAGMRGLNAAIFPEPMSAFTLRSFGAFYLALALAVVPLLIARGRGNLLTHGFAQYGLIVFITLAGLAFIDRFDFDGRPTQIAYLGIYCLVGAVVGFYLWRYGTGHRSGVA